MKDTSRWHDRFIECGIAGLLIFTPLAFAGVPVWSASLMQLAAFLIFIVWLRKVSGEAVISLQAGRILLFVGAFLVIAGGQLIPMPMGVLQLVSPATASLYRSSGAYLDGRWHPLSVYPQGTLNEFMNLLAYSAVFLVVMNHYKNREQILSLVRTIIIMACLLVVIAIVQKATWNGKLYGFYPIDPALESRTDYIWGPYINRNHFAGYLEMAIPMALGLLIHGLSRVVHSRRKNVWERMAFLAGYRKSWRVLLTFVAVVVLSGTLFATLSRGGVLGFGVSVLTMIVLARSRRSLRGTAFALLLVGSLVLFTGAAAVWGRLEERFLDLTEEDRVQRTQVWLDLRPMISDYPILGTGLGSFERIYPRYQTKYSTIAFEHAENDYLELLCDTGALGFVIVLSGGCAFFVSLVKAWRKRKNAFAISMGLGGLASCTALAVHSLTDFNLRIPANALLLTIISAITISSITYRPHNGEWGLYGIRKNTG